MIKHDFLDIKGLIDKAVTEVFSAAEVSEIQEMLDNGYLGALELAGLTAQKVAA